MSRTTLPRAVAPRASEPETLVGWREWVALPEWGIDHLKARIDTGARTSALHAFGMRTFQRDGLPWARFAIHPWQGSAQDEVVVEAPLLDERRVRSVPGPARHRPVVQTSLLLAGRLVPIEVMLTRRDDMGFRLLIGRQALRQTFLVDPTRSYLAGRPGRDIRRRDRGRAG